MTDKTTLNKREFLRKTVLTGAGAGAATVLAAPYVKAQAPIKWRLQTYAGPALAEHVIKNSIDWFNKAAAKGLPEAQHGLSYMAANGEGPIRDLGPLRQGATGQKAASDMTGWVIFHLLRALVA